jgi:hypothetical protein
LLNPAPGFLARLEPGNDHATVEHQPLPAIGVELHGHVDVVRLELISLLCGCLELVLAVGSVNGNEAEAAAPAAG